MLKNNEKGLTLIELLAVIVIAFFIMGIIYSAAKISINYYSVESTKTEMQQELNYIITDLLRVHRTNDSYRLFITDDEIRVIKENGEESIISEGYHYSTTDDYTTGVDVNPAIQDLSLENFTIKSKENENIEVSVETVISRYRYKE